MSVVTKSDRMMHLLRRATRRFPAITVVLLTAILVLVAFLHRGIEVTELDVDDGGIWVAKGADLSLGHLNYDALTFDGFVSTPSAQVALGQDGRTVTIGDETTHSVASVDVAAMKLGGASTVPEGSRVVQGASTIAVLDSLAGYLWVGEANRPDAIKYEDTSAIADGLADGIVVTPSHNPPRDGGFKYNPPHGGPADTDATGWIAARANELLDSGEWKNVPRVTGSDLLHDPNIKPFDYLDYYVSQLDQVIDIEAIRKAGVRIGADPLGGASIDYWAAIGEHYGLDLTVVNPEVDPAWPFMTLDWDGKIRMDCSSPYAMASLREAMTPDAEGNTPYDIATGNDADSDRHGIVTPDGLMNPNHFLAVAIEYLFTHRPGWSKDAAVGKTLVSSALIDRVVASMGRELIEVPVGFKYFVPGLLSGAVGFGGEESAGASFLRKDGTVWSTDKDGIILALLASEILAVTGKTPSQLHEEQVERFGASAYARIDAAASREEKAKLAALSPEDVTATELAGDPIVAKLVRAPGNDAPIGGLKVTTESAWFAARPSGTEDVYKIYAESFKGAEHLAEVQEAAKKVVSDALNG